MSFSAAEAAALGLLQAGRLEEAEAAWRELLAARPDDSVALHFLGCVLTQRGRVDEGLALIDRSVERAPDDASFLANRAHVLGGLGRDADAIADLRRAASLAPAQPGLHAALGRLLFARGDVQGALAAFEAALRLRPGDADLLNNTGLALQANGRGGEALARYAEALAARPAFPEALVNRGNALKDRGDLDAAAECYARAIALRPDFLPALTNAAGIALDRADPAMARTLYERALAGAPQLADARYGVGQVALRERRFAEGWAGYAWRFRTHPPQALEHAPPLPPLTEENLGSARRVALWAEQGVGDQILFSTLLPELAARGIEAVVETDPRLLALFRRSVPGVRFVAPSEAQAAFRACDAQAGLGSLPGLLRRDAADFARQPRALLRPDAARVEEYRRRLGPGRWVAVSWRSLQRGERRALAERKSAPLEAFAALGEAGARLLDVQYGDVETEREGFEARHPGLLTRLGDLDATNDLEALAAAMAACERVVSASNATVHLAGAAGLPTSVVFLRGWPPFHYWVDDGRGRSTWYPSVELPHAAWRTWPEALAAVAARHFG